MDVVKSFKDLDGRLQALSFGKIESVESVSPFDIQVKLEGGVFIEIFGLSTHDDEIFHIFGPDDLYVDFKIVGGWTIGKSNVPWTYS